jgi:ABC-type polar amino acid transport system ATPase subunit
LEELTRRSAVPAGDAVVDTVLRVRGLELDRSGRRILDRVSLDAARGDLVAIMGPSGSGKTTLLRAIAGLEPFQAGQIVIDDVTLDAGGRMPAATLRALRRKVGMVFQFHCLFEHLSALDNVCLAPVHAYAVPPRDARRRALDLLQSFGVAHRADALPRYLSGGEAQRVAIARALAVDPPVLLMDEPTASLDPVRRAELGELLRTLIAGGRTLVVATHDEEFARGWATRRLRVAEGGIVASD